MLGNPAQEGIIPRVLRDIFFQLNILYNNNLDNNYQIEMSIVELYNNYFHNLLISATTDDFDNQSMENKVQLPKFEGHNIEEVTFN